jgi:NAD(P)-dependent dehydrogenase (short-subunit alcohol dehydrogenase family)
MDTPDQRLKGRTAIVTGAAYGIGFAAAERFAAEGANVVLADIKGHEAAAARLAERSSGVLAVAADVTSDAQVDSLVQSTLELFGRIDILVNNAAISAELRPGPFEEQSAEDWRRIYEVNVIGVWRMCRAVSPHMRRQKWGRIVNIASGTAFKGAPGMLHYIASKGAIISMTRSLATEFGGDNVLVNAVSPGFTLTESVVASAGVAAYFGPQAVAGRTIKRDAVATDVANAIYFFASADAAFITGQTLTADGGSVFH